MLLLCDLLAQLHDRVQHLENERRQWLTEKQSIVAQLVRTRGMLGQVCRVFFLFLCCTQAVLVMTVLVSGTGIDEVDCSHHEWRWFF
jgi:hypothetical protein